MSSTLIQAAVSSPPRAPRGSRSESRREQALHCHLTFLMLQQHETTWLWGQNGGECRWAAAPRRSCPAASASARVDRAPRRGQHQLHIVPLHLGLGHYPRRDLAAAPAPRAVPLQPVAFAIPLGLSDGRPLRPFSRGLSSCAAIAICFSPIPRPAVPETELSDRHATSRKDWRAVACRERIHTRPRRGKRNIKATGGYAQVMPPITVASAPNNSSALHSISIDIVVQ